MVTLEARTRRYRYRALTIHLTLACPGGSTYRQLNNSTPRAGEHSKCDASCCLTVRGSEERIRADAYIERKQGQYAFLHTRSDRNMMIFVFRAAQDPASWILFCTKTTAPFTLVSTKAPSRLIVDTSTAPVSPLCDPDPRRRTAQPTSYLLEPPTW